MKNTFLKTLILFYLLSVPTLSKEREEQDNDNNHHDFIFTPEEEESFLKEIPLNDAFSLLFRFPQTSWKECIEEVSGNYINYNCTNRQISKILKGFMFNHFQQCISESTEKQWNQKATDVHITHVGILGDPNHSPNSLHSESRAIDIYSFKVKLENGLSKSIIYQNTENRPFYKTFRKCWGRAVHEYNDCPYYNNSSLLTGSIGWENSDHKLHMHVSVPYCVNGHYAGNYLQR